MPKPRWGWFAVAVAASITAIVVLQLGWVTITSTGNGPPGGVLFAAICLLAVWSFGKAFFDFKLPPRS